MTAGPYSPPQALEPELKGVRDYWESLIRGANDMPFWDDFKPSALPGGAIMLLDVFARPARFRFGSVVADDVVRRYGRDLQGLFTDEIDPHAPFEQLTDQCAATIASVKPTYFRSIAGAGGATYSRLLLPMWGDGRIGMLLGAFAWR